VASHTGTADSLVSRRLTRDLTPGRDRDIALALIIARVCRPASKLATTRWWTDTVRHEALLNRAVMKGHRLRLVAASRKKLRAA
jgi:hypothetical protein